MRQEQQNILLDVAQITKLYKLKRQRKIKMSYTELGKKLEQSIKTAKCANKGCLSANKDNLQVVWYGKQYDQKLITCSSCYIMNDEAVKKSLPTSQNILPVSAFINKFVSELKTYEENKSSPKWLPSDLKQRQKQHTTEMNNFQFKLTGTLKGLAQALQNFGKKVIQQNQAIYNNETFNQIISMYSNNQMEQSLSKIQSLIQFLNCGQDDKYRFDDIEFRTKRTDKLAHKIDEVNKKVTTVLEELLLQIQDKYAAIGKI